MKPRANIASPDNRSQGFYRRLHVGPNLFRLIMNCWPPFLGMRIHVERISPDWREVDVRMKLSLRNKNYVGTHFGGSLFAMTDSFYMIMLSHQMGHDYVVWDKAATIKFIAPGRRTVFANFRLNDAQIAEVKQATANNEKFEPVYSIDIVDGKGEVIASVDKTLYIRRKQAVSKA